MALSLANSVAPSKNCVNGNGKYFPFSFQTGKAAQTVIEFLNSVTIVNGIGHVLSKEKFRLEKEIVAVMNFGLLKTFISQLTYYSKTVCQQ